MGERIIMLIVQNNFSQKRLTHTGTETATAQRQCCQHTKLIRVLLVHLILKPGIQSHSTLKIDAFIKGYAFLLKSQIHAVVKDMRCIDNLLSRSLVSSSVHCAFLCHDCINLLIIISIDYVQPKVWSIQCELKYLNSLVTGFHGHLLREKVTSSIL